MIAATTSAVAYPNSSLAAAAEFSPEEIFSNLERAIWLSTNNNASKAAYVVAAPWCPYCLQLYQAQAESNSDVDFRFVFMQQRVSAPAVVNAYFSDTQDQVGQFYSDPRARNSILPPASGLLLDHVNLVTGHVMAGSFSEISSGSGGSSSGTGFAYPTVVQREKSGQITGTLGAWMMVEALTQRTAASLSSTPAVARYADYLRVVPNIKKQQRNYFASADGVQLYSAPVQNAPVIGRLPKGTGFKIAGTTNFGGENWIAIKAFTSTDAMKWGRVKDFYSR